MFVLLSLVLISSLVGVLGGEFLVRTNNSHCGQNYQVSFEINPSIVNDVGGVISVGDDLLVYFQWMSTSMAVDLSTNQGTLQLRSRNSLAPNKWSSVVIDVHRRSLGLSVGGDSYVTEHKSFGHIHAPKELFYVVNNTIEAPADAQLRNLDLTCTDRWDHDAYTEDSQSVMYSRLFDTMSTCGGKKREASPYRQYKIMNVRMTTFNGTTDPFMVVHAIDLPANQLYNVRIKLRSQASNSGFKYSFPAVSVPVLKTYNLNRATNQKKFMHKELRFHNHSTTRELELSGYVGKNQIIPTANDYNLRVELVQQVFDAASNTMVSAVVACVRMKNLTIGDYEYSTMVNLE